MAADAEQEFTAEVAASQAECFDVVMDFEAYPSWSSAVQEATILEKDAAGFGRIVEFFIDMRFKRVRYVLEYEHRKPTDLKWRSVDGDIQAIEGFYRFRKRSANLTEAICRQTIELGFWVPGPLRKLAERTALRQSVLEFKDAVEKHVAARAAGGAKKKSAKRG